MSDTVVIQQHRTRCFTILGNEVIRDRRLSYRARGLHHVLLSLAEGYQLRVSWLVEQGTDGRYSVLSGLKELQAYGYLAIRRERGTGGRFIRTVWVVTDTPGNSGGTPESEIRTEDGLADQEPNFGNTENRTVSTKEPSVEKTTTTYMTEGTNAEASALVMPHHLASTSKKAILDLLRGVPAADAQMLLDELEAALEIPGTIKTTPGRWFYGLVQRYAQGRFNPVGAPLVAARRAKADAPVKVARPVAVDPEVVRTHIAKIAAVLHVTNEVAK